MSASAQYAWRSVATAGWVLDRTVCWPWEAGHRDNQNHSLAVAQMFGGFYLVGLLWIAEADPQAVQHALGGTIRLKGKQ